MEEEKHELIIPEGWNLESSNSTHKKKARFLVALLNRPSGTPPNIGRAARIAGIDRKTAYNWREADPKFAAAWEEAKEAALDDLEEAVYKQGQSTPVAAFAYLKAHRDNWRDKQAIDLNVSGNLAELMQEARKRAKPGEK